MIIRRKTVMGYTDLGPVRIPPLPQLLILTDRDDGTLWLLSHSSDFTKFAITDTIPSGLDRVVYGAFDGPILGTEPELVRLLVRDGHLGYEAVNFGEVPTASQARVMSRRGLETRAREIVAHVGFRVPTGLTHREVDW